MRYILFISDLHLTEKKPSRLVAFEALINDLAEKADALYILGDFFAVWVGDDDDSAFNVKVKNLLRDLSKKTKVYLMVGNHDFLLGEKFAADSGCKMLVDYVVVDLYGRPTLLAHGDIFCVEDIATRVLHGIIRKRWARKLFAFFPLVWRKKIAQLVEDGVSYFKKKGFKSEHVVGLNMLAISECMAKNGATQLIHGHTHQAAVQEFTLSDLSDGNIVVRRFALNAWTGTGEKPTYLRYFEDGSFVLV
jgi:UDP-2,3-diacylglucosamine hydrolase